jgi:AmmeMemoRadiSam system protein B
MNARMPSVAGSFYPNNVEQLKRQLTNFIEEEVTDIVPKALIVPHAGYCYSGAIAGHGFSYLQHCKNTIERVILLGPSHRVPLRGCAVPSSDVFTTPLGDINIDQRACQQLQRLGLATCSERAHQWEHSLEVQLPFLQSCLNNFTLIPVVVGACQPNDVAALLKFLLRELAQSTLIVVSTDLSHYHSYEEAQAFDDDTIRRILALASDIEAEKACGCFALNGLLSYSAQQTWQIKLISKANSGDSKGVDHTNKAQVVGYASFILY